MNHPALRFGAFCVFSVDQQALHCRSHQERAKKTAPHSDEAVRAGGKYREARTLLYCKGQ
jgi:hypothetical protein